MFFGSFMISRLGLNTFQGRKTLSFLGKIPEVNKKKWYFIFFIGRTRVKISDVIIIDLIIEVFLCAMSRAEFKTEFYGNYVFGKIINLDFR